MLIKNIQFSEKPFTELDDAGKLRQLAGYACLAPSSHNTQPWLFKLVGRTIIVRANTARRLVASDKQGREMYISLGAAVSNLQLAAQALGLKYDLETSTSPDAVAVFKFGGLDGAAADTALLQSLTQRENSRNNFEDRAVSGELLEKIKGAAGNLLEIHFVDEVEKKEKISNIIGNATKAAFLDAEFTEELSHWIKPSLKKYEDGMPGYNLGVPWFFSLALPWIIKYVPSANLQRFMVLDTLRHTPAFGVITTKRDSPGEWLLTGQVFEKAAVQAQSLGLKIGVLAAPVEIGGFYKEMQEVLQTADKPQLFFRLGYCKKTSEPAPRLALNKVIIQQS